MGPKTTRSMTQSDEINVSNINDMIAKLNKDVTTLLPLESKMDKVLELILNQNEKIDHLERQLTSQMNENKNLKQELGNARNEIDDLQQRSRLNNIIINGISESKNEDVYKIVFDLGRKLNIEDPSSHIQIAHRVRTTMTSKPKPIVVRLLNTKTRDIWTKAYREKKMWEQKVYVNEHLTRKNQGLLKKAKEFKDENDFNFVWVRDCKVFIRKNENSRVFVIRSDADFERILGIKNSNVMDESSSSSELLVNL